MTAPKFIQTGAWVSCIIKVGAEKDISLPYNVVSVSIRKEINRIPTAKVVLFDGDQTLNDFLVSSEDLFKPGEEVEIGLGYDAKTEPVFNGVLMNHGIRLRPSGKSEFYFDSKDAAVALTHGRKTMEFTGPEGDAIKKVITDGASAKLKVKPGEVAGFTLTHPKLVQYNSTDWDFIVSRAEANGLIVLANNGEVAIKAPDTAGAPKDKLEFGSTLKELEADMDAERQLKEVAGFTWDSATQKLEKGEGKDPNIEIQGDVKAADLSAIGEYSENLNGGNMPKLELDAWAKAIMMKNSLAKIRGKLKCVGTTKFNPGDIVELFGLGKRFMGKAFISAVEHEYKEGKWVTILHTGIAPKWFKSKPDIMEPPAGGLLPGISGLQIGVVAKFGPKDSFSVDKPDDFHVLVTIPGMGGADVTVWARLANLYAGKLYGNMSYPETGDEVIIGFANNDPRHPVILGSLFSKTITAPAPWKDTSSEKEKTLITKGKTKILYMGQEAGDGKGGLSIEGESGNKILIEEKAGDESIILEDKNKNKISMTKDGIVIESAKDITFKGAKVNVEATDIITVKTTADVNAEGANVNLKASAKLAAEGAGGVDLKTSAVNTIAGNPIKLN